MARVVQFHEFGDADVLKIEDVNVPAPASDAPPGIDISLVLGSGGARGYAHIGVIEELEAQGFAIRSIALNTCSRTSSL